MRPEVQPLLMRAATAEWGSWGLGDLADAVRRAAETLGSSLEVHWVSIEPPTRERDLPRVRVLVPDAETTDELREKLVADEPLPHFTGNPFAAAWTVEVNDLELCIGCDQAAGASR